MNLTQSLQAKVAKWPYGLVSLFAALSAFGTYTSMYAFRKAIAAGTFTGQQYFHIDYKVWLVITQIIGYTISKFYGIKFIAELQPGQRAKSILILIGIAWLALLFFAFTPAPYNIIFLFINGFPLGLIWGLVFGYLEGRKSTEFMAAVLSISLIFASGFVKTVARTLMSSYHVSEYRMPFITGAVFFTPMLLFLFCLELIPPPTAEDIKLRTKRLPMDIAERKKLPDPLFTGNYPYTGHLCAAQCYARYKGQFRSGNMEQPGCKRQYHLYEDRHYHILNSACGFKLTHPDKKKPDRI